jgi:aspartate/methionine/tyrosine aminotransferase
MDDDGLQIDALERALAEGPKPAFLYTIATFQNPSGRTLSEERRRRIAELAREHDLLVLEDDPYGLVRYEGTAPPTIFELEGGTNVAYASSFSKTVAPGVRVGYFVLPPALAADVEARAVATYISPPFLTQATVHEFVSRGNFEPNLERVRALLGARRDAMLEALERHLPDGSSWSRPEGGYFIWSSPEETHPQRGGGGGAVVKGTDFTSGAGRRGRCGSRSASSPGGDRRGDRGLGLLRGAGGGSSPSCEQDPTTKPTASRADQPDQRHARRHDDEAQETDLRF